MFITWCLLGIIKDQSSIALHLPHFIILCRRDTDRLHSILTVLTRVSLTIIRSDKLTSLFGMITFDKDYRVLALLFRLLVPQITGNFDAATNRIPPTSCLWKHFSNCSLFDLTSVDPNHFTLGIRVLVTFGDILSLTIRIVLGHIPVVILGGTTGLIAYSTPFLSLPRIIPSTTNKLLCANIYLLSQECDLNLGVEMHRVTLEGVQTSAITM